MRVERCAHRVDTLAVVIVINQVGDLFGVGFEVVEFLELALTEEAGLNVGQTSVEVETVPLLITAEQPLEGAVLSGRP